ncbi:Hypothetical protein; putative SAM-dependent methyltransferase domain protein [Bradyrhizobium sp. ORS 278]|uniref:class I SAM-dependent methyltransferase n=1 Tax=Bradyrhizobium sp. (strain ORS 278) TaxID=114615 RepID=UPI00015089C4|nr:class I SAM-dependent methyltransferase [Bradyrhizobium sp. ORS 278]CAL78885.1 Hypothetical protein; putative SAM-dependent methyltransferase domain protein [Bradyrhizobium sp. ORS 278]
MDERQTGSLKRLKRPVDYVGRYQTSDYVADRVSRAVIDCLVGVKEPTVVEIGCGTGETLLAVARARPDAQLIGLDISSLNIEAADRKRENDLADRVTFVASDFMNWQGPQADLIFAESVLHLVVADTDRLVERLASTLRAGGQLVFTIPRDCLRNHALFLLRRAWSTLPHKAADHVALALARKVYPTLPEDLLRDRLGYLRLIPERTDGAKLHESLRRNGLSPSRRTVWPVTTLLQASHSFSVWRKD